MFLGIPLSPHNVVTFLVFLLVAWSIYMRWSGKPESNWALIAWGVVFAYQYGYQGELNPLYLWTGLGLTLLIRFEFMAAGMLKLLMVAETAAMLYVVGATFLFLQGQA